MSEPITKADRFYTAFARSTIQFRWLLILPSLLIIGFFSYGVAQIEFSAHFKSFFSKDNPDLQAYNALVEEYVEPVNIMFVVHPLEGDVYSVATLQAVAELTERAWQLPYVNRVDSLANYQHTWVEEDDLIVAALVEDPEQLDDARIAEIKRVATSEPLILNRLVSKDGRALLVVANNAFSGSSFEEVQAANLAARDLAAEVGARFPQLKLALGGYTIVNYSTFESAMYDMPRLIPAMFAIMLLLAWIALRSISMTFGLFIVIVFSSIVAVGTAGFAGFPIDTITAISPVVVMTLAVADSIHILLTMRDAMASGQTKNDALVESVRINFAPIAITSLTTALGFMTITTADAPPLAHLGVMTAGGVIAAWVFSIVLLPALISLLPIGAGASQRGPVKRLMDFGARVVIAHRKKILVFSSVIIAALIACIPQLEFNDEFSEYTSTRMQSRRDIDFTRSFFSIDSLEYSIPAGVADGINNPAYLKKLDEFAEWLRSKESVESVYSVSDVVKRLNKNLHGDDPTYFTIPESAEAAAQYLLLYELSLPYGLDLNDRFNIDKSASRLSVAANIPGTREGRKLVEEINRWIDTNLPPKMQTRPTGMYIMFAHIAERNIEAMIGSTFLLIIAIGAVMMIGLRSFWLGLMSLIPTCLPIAVAMGIWALLVGEVGMSISIVAAISLGIIIDNAVHIISKFIRALRVKGLNNEDALRYMFNHVGVAIFFNTVILTIGFLLLTASVYRVNVEMGALTVIAIITAYVIDILMLPAMLMTMGELAPSMMGRVLGQPSRA